MYEHLLADVPGASSSGTGTSKVGTGLSTQRLKDLLKKEKKQKKKKVGLVGESVVGGGEGL